MKGLALVASVACATFAPAVASSVGKIGEHRHEVEVSNDPAKNEARFLAFLQQHGRSYAPGSEEYGTRLRAFQERLSVVEAQNALPEKQWTAAVNALADRTPEELAALRGYRHGARAETGGARASLGLVSTGSHTVDVSKLPDNWDWKQLQAMKDVKDQKSCGSCWAVSSATVLRAHAELYQKDRTFSIQQILDCTPNPRSCGGTGGCGGATAELAMDYVANVGSVTEEERQYLGATGSCPSSMVAVEPAKARPAFLAAASFAEVAESERGGAKFGMVGWKKLPENKAEPLMLAVYEQGPVVVSVSANDKWNMYSHGVLNACDKDTVINHAVALTGYGVDGPTKYWKIQNSWGPQWGESGFIRIERQDSHNEGEYCGWDTSPEQGTACKGGPSKVRVCGACGILYDSVVPTFVLGEEGLLKRMNLRNSTV